MDSLINKNSQYRNHDIDFSVTLCFTGDPKESLIEDRLNIETQNINTD